MATETFSALIADRGLLVHRELRHRLKAAGVRVTGAYSTAELMLRCQQDDPAVIVLAVPGTLRTPAPAVVLELRRTRSTPVVLLVAPEHRAALEDLHLPGTSLLATPLEPEALLVELHAAVTRPQPQTVTVSRPTAAGPLRWEPHELAIYLDSRPLELSFTQYQLLRTLIEQPGQLVPLPELARIVRGASGPGDRDAAVRGMQELRELLADRADLLLTARGQGYLLDLPSLPETRAEAGAPGAAADHAPQLVRFGSLVVHLGQSEARVAGRLLALPRRENDILMALAARPGRCLSQQELADLVWPDRQVTVATVRRLVYRLRKRLTAINDQPAPTIMTVPQHGYRLGTDTGEDVELASRTAPAS